MFPTVTLFGALVVLADVALGKDAHSGSGEVMTIPLYDGYDLDVDIGTPAQRVRMTAVNSVALISVPNGESDSDECTYCRKAGFNLAASTSSSFVYKREGKRLSTATETFAIGDVVSETLPFFYSATDDFTLYFGLNRHPRSWFEIEAAKGTWNGPLYSVYSRRERDTKTGRFAPGRSGEVTFGAWDAARMDGDFTWIPAMRGDAHDYVWDGALQGVAFNGKELSLDNGRSAPHVHFEVGATPNIIGPLRLLEDMAKSVGGEVSREIHSESEAYDGTLVVPCEADLDLGYTINGVTFSITRTSLLAKELGDGMCATVLVASDYYEVENKWILGEAFCSNFYMAFRSGVEPAVGIAKLRNETTGAKIEYSECRKEGGSDTCNLELLQGPQLYIQKGSEL